MARKWTISEENKKRNELVELYVKRNKTISEIARMLNLGESTIYDRLVRLGIQSLRRKKIHYNNIRKDINIPKFYSAELAEFIGILLGDGHLSPTQVTITLGKKDEYADYVAEIMKTIFEAKPKNIILPSGHRLIYLGSTVMVRWLISMGLTFNKVKNQVDIPSWIFSKKRYMRATLRGLFDTDGSVYKLKFGVQISFSNRSKPLIRSARKMLCLLGFRPSKVSGKNIYLTKKENLKKFFNEIGFKNKKHEKRFLNFCDGSVA